MITYKNCKLYYTLVIVLCQRYVIAIFP